MEAKHDETENALAALRQSPYYVNPDDFTTVMDDLIDNGMKPAQARFHAATNLTNASYADLADAFDITKGSISSAAGDTKKTIRNTSDLFIHFVNGPKKILAELTIESRTETTKHFIARYIHGETDSYTVITRTVNTDSKYSDPDGFKSLQITDYDTVDELAENYYEQHWFDSVSDAYAVWDALHDESVTRHIPDPDERLTAEAEAKSRRHDGVLYELDETTDNLSMMDSWDGLLVMDGEVIDVHMGRDGFDSYSIRAESGAEIAYIEDGVQAPDIVEAYVEVGSLSRRTLR